MADNLEITDAAGVTKVVKTTEDSGIHTPHNIIDFNPSNGLVDAFGRLRVSQVTTQLDAKQLHDKLPLFFDEVTNATATSVHSTLTASTTMATVASGDYAIRQTKQRFNYQSGKSQQIFITFGGFEAEANVNKKVGYFSSSISAPYTADLDGIFLENDGTNVYLKVYRTGTEVFSVVQSSWTDPLDGTGASGLTVDWSKTQILTIAFEWLGVGSVFFGLIISGQYVPFYKTENANVLTEVYMSSPNQPIRYEIRQSGAGSGSFKTICATVGSEGSLNKLGKLRHFGQEVTSITLASSANTYPLIALKLQAAKLDSIIDLINLSILETSSKRIHYEILFNPTFSAPLSYSDLDNSSISAALGNGTITVTDEGTDLYGDYVDSNAISTSVENAIRLGANIDGTEDVICLAARPIAANAVVYSSLTWRELI